MKRNNKQERKYNHVILLGFTRIHIYVSTIETIKIGLNKNYDPTIWEAGGMGVV